MESTQMALGNITSGKLAERYGRDIIGKVGFFYKVGTEGGALPASNYRKLVKVTGYRRQNGIMAFTYTDLRGGDFICLEGVKFAAYSDQEDAEAVFSYRQGLYGQIMKTYNHASATGDKDAKAYSSAAMEALMTVD